MTELELIDLMISQLRTLKASLKRRDKKSEKVRLLTPRNATPKRIENANADLNWECMEIDMQRTDIARTYKNSVLDVSTEKKTYNPSAFHSYRH